MFAEAYIQDGAQQMDCAHHSFALAWRRASAGLLDLPQPCLANLLIGLVVLPIHFNSPILMGCRLIVEAWPPLF